MAYIIAQCIGGIIAATLLFAIVNPTFTGSVGEFATNGWVDALAPGELNPFGGTTFGMGSAFAIEAVLTFVFLLVIIGSTDRRAPAGLAPIAIGLCLTLIILISITVTNTSVNPARSTAVAIFVGGMPLKQLWLFWVAPIVGGIVAGVLYRFVFEKSCDKKCCCKDGDKKCCCKEDAAEEAKAEN